MSESDDELLSIGVDKIIDGVPKGSLVVVVSEPQVSLGAFLAQISNQRETTYISTKRPRSVVEREMYLATGKYEAQRTEPEDYEIRELFSVSPDKVSDEILTKLGSAEEGTNFIVNEMTSVTEQLADENEFGKIFRRIEKMTKEKELLTILNFVAPSYEALTKEQQYMLEMSDLLLKLDLDNDSGSLITQIRVDKFRDKEDMDSYMFKVNIRDQVTIPPTSEV